MRAIALVLVLCGTAVACAKSPLAPVGGFSVGAPPVLAPANGAFVPQTSQPITLTVKNATSTGGPAFVSYTFEVATDEGFVATVASRNVAEARSQTSATIDVLPAGKYFWRVRANVGESSAATTKPYTFTIIAVGGETDLIQAPVPDFPASGAVVIGTRPVLTVVNALRSSSVGAVAYWFEIATDAAFTNLVSGGGAAEGVARSSFTPASGLSLGTTYFWRARAFEIGSGRMGPSSTARTFVTSSAP